MFYCQILCHFDPNGANKNTCCKRDCSAYFIYWKPLVICSLQTFFDFSTCCVWNSRCCFKWFGHYQIKYKYKQRNEAVLTIFSLVLEQLSQPAAQAKVLRSLVYVFALVNVSYVLSACLYFDNLGFDIFDTGCPQCHFITSVTIAVRIRTHSVYWLKRNFIFLDPSKSFNVWSSLICHCAALVKIATWYLVQ